MIRVSKIPLADSILFDFADSFTFNIASILHRLGISFQVISLKDAFCVLEQLALHKKRKVIIFGPGPGTPQDYSFLFPAIRPLLKRPYYFHMGICLGHQLLATLRGYQIERCSHPCHGQREKFIIPPWPDIFPRHYIDQKILVQRYNSLRVKRDGPLEDKWPLTGEIMACRFKGGVSFQFHPESVGTSCPYLFFNTITKFLYNKKDEQKNPHRRDLQQGNAFRIERYTH